jgi:ribosomal protein S12 methylthiotransferase
MALQAGISAERLEKKIGERLTVLVDEVTEDRAVARSHGDAPEIDGCVYVEGSRHLAPGDFVDVDVVGADEHDLWASPAPGGCVGQ